MVNDRLRGALAARALTVDVVSARAGVDPKTVQRWLAGRTPHARHRWAIAALVREDEAFLWPAITRNAREADPFARVVADELAGVTAAYASRSRFLADYSPERLFSGAAAISMAGLSNNISLLQRLRARLPSPVQDRLWLGTYDETIRFNIVVVERADDTLAVVQPYLPHARGGDSPTLVLGPSAEPGLFETFTHVLAQLKLKATRC